MSVGVSISQSRERALRKHFEKQKNFETHQRGPN
jgi:hypothetical protein